MRPPGGRGQVMVANYQQGGDAGLRKAHHAFTPFPLEGGCRGAVAVGVTAKEHQIHLFSDGRIHDRVQRFEEIKHTQGQTAFGVVPPEAVDINVRIGKMQDLQHNFPGGLFAVSL